MCGILGLTLPEGGDPHAAARHSFFGLFALQHRGQEGAGLATADGTGARLHKDTGLVTQLLTEDRLRQLPGRHAIGHTRYSTTGSSVARNAQPFLVETRHGPLGLVHNGNLTNAGELREELLDRGFPLAATSDSEVILLMLASAGASTWEARIERTMPSWKGAFSLVVLASDGIIAVRDPWGFRPLSIGRMPNGGWMAASETCALTTLGCTEIREVEPGEIVSMSGDTISSTHSSIRVPALARCSFEHVYFSRPDSNWDSTSVHHVRQRLGELLAEESGVEADVVVPVPDSSIPAAIGYSRHSGIPVNDGFIKNRYIGRTFIEPTQAMREKGVAMKFNVLAENLVGRRVIMIDDSIIRGTTAGPLVKMLRDAGATEVHVRITCPPIAHPCHMGLDMGTYDELISHRVQPADLAQLIGADSLAFLSLESLMKAIGRDDGYCNACFTGVYPVPVPVTIGRTKESFEGVLR